MYSMVICHAVCLGVLALRSASCTILLDMASMYRHMLTMQGLLDVVESVACMYPYMRQTYLISVTAREAIVLALDLQYVNLQFQLCTVCNSICWAKQSQQQLHYRFFQPHFLYAVHKRCHFLLIWQQVQVLAQSTFGCIRQSGSATYHYCVFVQVVVVYLPQAVP